MGAYSRKTEALAEALMHYSGYLEPSSELHAARNPGGLKATSMKHIRDDHGHRIFSSFLDGLQASLYDLHQKVTGQSWVGVGSDNTLKFLALSYSLPVTTANAWAKFLRASLKDDSISADTELGYFA